jgi:hypothetical protein
MDAFLGKPFTEHELHHVLVLHGVVPAATDTQPPSLGAAYAARL